MPRSSRRVLTLVLVTALAATAALAQPPTAARGVSVSADLFDRLWSFLAQSWSKNGCEFDPNGRCREAAKNGCEVDPSGRCQATKNGCEVDPDGRCLR